MFATISYLFLPTTTAEKQSFFGFEFHATTLSYLWWCKEFVLCATWVGAALTIFCLILTEKGGSQGWIKVSSADLMPVQLRVIPLITILLVIRRGTCVWALSSALSSSSQAWLWSRGSNSPLYRWSVQKRLRSFFRRLVIIF